jgi:hypothetical protein
VDLANFGSELEKCVGSRVHLVGVSVSFDKIFFRLPITPPPSLIRRIGTSVIHSTCRAPTIKAHGTPFVAAGYGRRLTKSVVLHAARELPHLQTWASSRRSGPVSRPTTRVPSGGTSWWFRQMNHHGLARQTPRRHVRSRATPTAPRGRRRSSTWRYLHAPATYTSSSKRRGCQRSIALRPTGCGYGMSPASQPLA